MVLHTANIIKIQQAASTIFAELVVELILRIFICFIIGPSIPLTISTANSSTPRTLMFKRHDSTIARVCAVNICPSHLGYEAATERKQSRKHAPPRRHPSFGKYLILHSRIRFNGFIFVVSIPYINKKTWTSFVYVSEVSANTQQPLTSKSPRRTDVSILTFTLGCSFILQIFGNKIQADASLSMSKSVCLCHRQVILHDSAANIRFFFSNRKGFAEFPSYFINKNLCDCGKLSVKMFAGFQKSP